MNLKVSKRKVRLERCKTGVAAARAKAAAATAREVKALPVAIQDKTRTTGVPRDPASFMKTNNDKFENRPRMSNSNTESAQQAKLAEALAKLDPKERKAVKAIDQDRLERRSAKKTNKRLGERSVLFSFEFTYLESVTDNPIRERRYERKQAAADKNGGILGRPSRGEERARKEAKRVKAGNKTGKRAKPIK
jgi:nucleolar protein 12